jgi:hypothetical protein
VITDYCLSEFFHLRVLTFGHPKVAQLNFRTVHFNSTAHESRWLFHLIRKCGLGFRENTKADETDDDGHRELDSNIKHVYSLADLSSQ